MAIFPFHEVLFDDGTDAAVLSLPLLVSLSVRAQRALRQVTKPGGSTKQNATFISTALVTTFYVLTVKEVGNRQRR
jgi:hypothetical protein